MGNKFKRLIMFLIMVLGIGLFATEEKKAPNEIIKDNPDREVTTVESMKVRDHATMSLSVTKKKGNVIEGILDGNILQVKLPVKDIPAEFISKEVLKRGRIMPMARSASSAPRGKRLILSDGKSKKVAPQARMAMSSTGEEEPGVVNRFPTQEEMNNLTPEKIRELLANKPVEAPAQDIVEPGKEYLISSDETGTTIEVFDVKESDNLVFNVQEDGKITETYKVDIKQGRFLPRANPSPLQGYLVDKVLSIKSGELWLVDKNKRVNIDNGGISKVGSLRIKGNNLNKLVFEDDFLGKREINLALNDTSAIIGTAFKVEATSDVKPSATGVHLIPHVGSIGSNNEAYTDMEIGVSTENTYSKLQSVGTFYTKRKSSSSSIINSFKSLTLREIDKNSTITSPLSPYMRGKIVNTGFEYSINVEDENAIRYPGVYTTETGKELTAEYYAYSGIGTGQLLMTTTLNNIKIDIGDSAHDKSGDGSSDMNFETAVIKNLPKEPNREKWDDLSQNLSEDQKISFMSNQEDGELGLWLIDSKGNKQRIKRYNSTTPEENIYSLQYEQGVKIHNFKLRVSQAQGEWAKVEIQPEFAPPGENIAPFVEFKIVQGKRVSKGTTSANDKIVELRILHYVVKYNPINIIDLGEIVTSVDLRVKDQIKDITYISLEGRGSKNLVDLSYENGSQKNYKDYGAFLKTEKKLNKNINIKKIIEISKNNAILGLGGVEGEYVKYGDVAIRLTGNRTFELQYIDAVGNFVRRFGDYNTIKVIFNGTDGKYYSFLHKVETYPRVGEFDINSFNGEEGHIQYGVIQFGNIFDTEEYLILTDNEFIGVEHTIGGGISNYPNFYGYFDKNGTKPKLANKYELYVRGENKSYGIKNLGEPTKFYNERFTINLKNTDTQNLSIKTKTQDDGVDDTATLTYYYEGQDGVRIKLGSITFTMSNSQIRTNMLSITIDPRAGQKSWWITERATARAGLYDTSEKNLKGLVKNAEISIGSMTLRKSKAIVKNVSTNEEYVYDSNSSINGYNIYEEASGQRRDVFAFVEGYQYDWGSDKLNIFRRYHLEDENDIKFIFNGSNRVDPDINPEFLAINHHWEIIRPTDPGYVSDEIGFQGSGSIDLTSKSSGTNEYILTENNSSENNIMVDNFIGTFPNFKGIDNTPVASYYTVKLGNNISGVQANIGNEIEVKRNSGDSNNLFKIKLDNDGKIKIIKTDNKRLNNEELKIEYYHQSGIKLGEYTLTVFNAGSVQNHGKITTEIDPRMEQKKDYYFSLSGSGGYEKKNIENGVFEKMLKSTPTLGNIQINSIDKVYSGSNEYIYEDDTTNNFHVYKRSYTDNSQDEVLISKSLNNLSQVNSGKNLLRKYRTDKEITVHLTQGSTTYGMFTHGWNVKSKPGNFNNLTGYSGSGEINLSEHLSGRFYEVSTTSGEGKIQVTLTGGTLPNTKGLISTLSNTNIATKYVINDSDVKLFGEEINLGDGLVLKLEESGNNGVIKVKKMDDSKYSDKTIKIDYYYDSKIKNDIEKYTLSDTAIKLGSFTLKVSNQTTDIGEVTIKLDQRITNLTNGTATSWIGLNGDLSSLGYDFYQQAVKEFIETSGNFSGYGDGTDTVNKIIEVNGKRTSDNITVNGVKYTKFEGKNEGAFPIEVNVNSDGSNGTDISISEFVQTGTDGKLVISRYDSSSSMHDGNNKFVLKTNTGKVLEGNIKELYMDRRGNTSGQVSASTEVRYMGEGKINLSVATPNQIYTFNRTSSDNIIKSNEGEIFLEMTSGEILDGSTPGRGAGARVANKLILNRGTPIEVGDKTATLEGTAIDGKVKIGIDTYGNLTITKLSDEEITATSIMIEYSYKIANGIEIPLGQFTLTVESTKKDLGEATIKVDGRLVKEKTNLWWYRADGRAFRNLDSASESQTYPEMLSTIDFANAVTTGINSDNTFIVDSNVTGKTDNGIRNLDGITYGIYGQSQGSNDISFPKYGLRADELLSKLMIKRSGKGSYNFNVFTSTTHYVGNINQQIVDLYHDSTANMDLTGVNVNTIGTWNSESTGSSTSNGMTMTFNNTGKLFLMDNMDKTKGIVTHYKAYIGTTEPTTTTEVASPTSLNLSAGTGNTTNDIEISFVTSSNKYQFKIKKLTDEEMSGTVVVIPYYKDIPLGKLSLAVTNTAREAGDIRFTVDSRLANIASTTDGSVNWLTAEGMYGTWSDKYNYKAFLTVSEDGLVKKTDGSLVLTKDTMIESIESINDSTSFGTDPTYKIYNNGTYNELALKEGQDFSTYISGDSLMFSPKEEKNLKTIVEDSDGNRYRVDIVVTIANKGYSGLGKLNIYDAVVGNPYTFSKPISGQESTDGVLTMTGISNFPEIEVSNGGTPPVTTKANMLEVTTPATTNITKETSITAIGGKVYKIDNKISVEITTSGEIKVTKLSSDSFEYKGANAIVIKYLYDVSNGTLTKPVVGSFRLEITDEKTFEEIGTVTFKIDARMAQIMNTTNTGTFKAWTGLNGKIRRKDGTDPENFSDFISSTGSFTNFDSSAVILDILEINGEKPASEGSGGYTASGYKSPTTTSTDPNEAAMPFTTGMTMREFTYTSKENSKLVISRDDMYDSKHTGENKFLLEAKKIVDGEEVKVKYRGNLQEKYIKLDNAEVVHLDINDVDNLIHRGSGEINLAPLKLKETYSFEAGSKGEISPISGPNKEIIKLIVPNNSSSLDARGLFTGNKRVANKMIVTVAGNKGTPVKAGETEALLDTILDEKVTVGIDKYGRLRINKNVEENITTTKLTIDYYYDPVTTTNNLSSTAIQLGTFDLTIKNPVENLTLKNVKIDSRLAGTKYKWLIADGKAKVNLDDTDSADYSKLFKFEPAYNKTATVYKVLGMPGRTLDTTEPISNNYELYNSTSDGVAAMPIPLNSGEDLNLYEARLTIGLDKISANNEFSILVEDNNEQKVLKGNIQENIYVEERFTGRGEIKFLDEHKEKTYSFGTTYSDGEISATNDGTTLIMRNIEGNLPNGNSLAEITTTPVNIADKIVVITADNTTTTNASSTQTVDGIVFGIDNTQGGLTIQRTNNHNVVGDKTYKIIFYHSAGGEDIKLSEFDLIVRDAVKDIGNITIEIDKRLATDVADSHSWITLDGKVKSFNELIGNTSKNYSEFINISGNFDEKQYDSADDLEGIVSINGSRNNIAFLEEFAIVKGENEVAIPYKGMTMGEFVNVGEGTKLVVSKWDYDHQNHTGQNAFVLQGRKADGTIVYYKGNIVEDYQTNTSYEGTGTLDITSATIGTEYVFASTEKNKISSNGLTLNITSGEPLNARGIFDEKNKNRSIANRMKISIDGSEEIFVKSGDELKGNILSGLVSIGISNLGDLTVTKIKNGEINSKDITITYYYAPSNNGGIISGETIQLGTFTLTLTNTITDIGKYTIEIDNRMSFDRNNGGKKGFWYLANGTIVSGITIEELTDSMKYEKMIRASGFNNNYPNVTQTPSMVEAVGFNEITDKIHGWVNNETYGRVAFNKGIGDYILLTLPKTKTQMNEYKDWLAVNLESSDGGERNPYSFIVTVNNQLYKGEVEGVYGTQEKHIGNATLDLGKLHKGSAYTWSSESTGENLMIFDSTSGKLFNMGSYGGAQITNKFTYKVGDGQERTVDSTSAGVLETEIALNAGDTKDIKISFVEDGLQITKLTNEEIPPTILKIVPKYKDIVLGELNLTVFNDIENLGSIEVEVDRRLAQVTATDWLGVDGKLYNSTGVYGDYSEFIGKVESINTTINDIDVLDYVVIDIESINDQAILNSIAGTRANYKYYATDKNETALPVKLLDINPNVTLANYDINGQNPLVVISKKDIATTTRNQGSTDVSTTNEFILTARTNGTQSEDKLYRGTITERYVGSGAYSGEGNIDLVDSKIGSTYTFATSKGNNNFVTGTGSSNGGTLTLNITSGTPVNTLGLVNGKTDQNIANKLEVKFTDYNNDTVAYKDTIIISSTTSSIEYNNLTIGIDTTTGGLTLKRDGSSGVRKVEINYYYDPDTINKTLSNKKVLLGTFTLTIKNVLELGEVTVDIDSRLLQIEGASWIKLSNENISALDGTNSKGNYPLFVTLTGNFVSDLDFDKYTVLEINKINDRSPDGTIGIYRFTNDNKSANEAAFPTGIELLTFIKTDSTSKLVVSKYNYENSNHNGQNKFVATAKESKDTNAKAINIIGNIKEDYNTPTIKDGYTGEGSINLVRAELGTTYTFDPQEAATTPSRTTIDQAVTLTVTKGTSVNAKGLVESKDKSIANLMEITVSGATEPIRVPGTANTAGQVLEKTGIAIGDGDAQITLGITADGGFKIAKTKEGNINSIPVKIDYYFSPNPSDESVTKVKLGTFTLTINNPVIDGGEAEVEIDERFASFERYNWLFRNNGTGKTATDMTTDTITKYDYFVDFFKYGAKKLNVDGISGTIIEALRVDGRKHRSNDKPGKPYVSFNIESTDWRGEAAVPKSGDIANINELMVASKGNVSLTDNISLNNKFALVFTDNTDSNIEKIYTGNIKETIIEADMYSGSGKVNILKTKKDTTYKFATTPLYGNIESDNGLTITNISGTPVKALGVVEGTENKVVANRIQVTFKNGTAQNEVKKSMSPDNLSVSHGNLTIGITTDDTNKGGLSLTRTSDKAENINIKEVFIEYFYDATPTDNTINISNTDGDTIKLGEFTLAIEKPEFAIDGNDILNFGTMIPGYTKTIDGNIDITNPKNKNITFRVEPTEIMTLNGEHLNKPDHSTVNIPTEKILNIIGIRVQRVDNHKFYITATADPKKENMVGDYRGEIEVVVDILDP